jgi:hypothetical protein
MPPRSGGPTPKRIAATVEPEGVEADVEPEADDAGGKRRRPGPAPQPA